MKNLLIFAVLILLSSCKSNYEFASNGFIVEGDEYFVNVDRSLSVYVGDHFTKQKNASNSGLQTINLNNDDKKIINKLHYLPKDYTVLFTGLSKENDGFRLISLINNKPTKLFSRENKMVSRVGFTIKETKEGKYYFQTQEINGNKVYHTIIPFKTDLGKEEFVSLIFLISIDKFKDFSMIEDLAISNASHYKNRYVFTPSRTEILCPEDSNRGHLDYRIPKEYVQSNYSLLKGYADSLGKRKLVIYRLVSPNQSYGSFVVCKGEYEVELTNLQHKLIWKDKILVKENLSH